MIELHTFGRVELTSSSGQEIRAVLAQPKRAALLVYLAVAQPRGFQRRDALLALFWPELDQERARAALRKAVHHLRRALSDAAIEGRGDEEVRLAEEVVWCDAAAFETALDGGDPEAAVGLYRGPFLDAFFAPDAPEFEQWMESERARLHRRAFDAAWQVTEAEERKGNTFGAAYWARRAAACCDVVNRGAAYAEGRIVSNLLDGHTVAVDAASGKEIWKTRVADGRWRYGGSDAAIFHSIFYGRPRGMPAFGGHLPAESIWRLVAYLRSLEPVVDTLSTTAW